MFHKSMYKYNWINPFPNNKFSTLPNWIPHLMKMEESNFSFSHSVFKRLVLQTHKNQGLFGKGLRYTDPEDWLFNSTTQSRLLTTLKQRAFENNVWKEENAGNQQILLFPQSFLPFPNQFWIFHSHLFCRLQMLSIWKSLRFCHFVKS